MMIPMYRLTCMDYMDLTVCCPRKAVKFNHSLVDVRCCGVFIIGHFTDMRYHCNNVLLYINVCVLFPFRSDVPYAHANLMSQQPVMSLPPSRDVPQGFVNAASSRDFPNFPLPQSHYYYTGQFQTGPDFSQGQGHKGDQGSFPPMSYAGRPQERAFRGMVEDSNSSAMRGDFHPSHSQEHSGMLSSHYNQKGQEHFAGASGGRYGNPAMSTFSPMRASGAYAAVHSQFADRGMQGFQHYPGGNEQPMEQPLPSSTPHGFSMYDAAAGNPSGKPSPTERSSYHPYGAASMPTTRPTTAPPGAPPPTQEQRSPAPTNNTTSVITERSSGSNEPPADKTSDKPGPEERATPSEDEEHSESPRTPIEEDTADEYPKVHVIAPNPDVQEDSKEDKSEDTCDTQPAPDSDASEPKPDEAVLHSRASMNTPPPLKPVSPARMVTNGPPSSPSQPDASGEPDSALGGSRDHIGLPEASHPASNPSPSRSTPPPEVPPRPASSDPSFRFDGLPPSFDELRHSLSADESSLSFTSPPRPDPSAFTPRPSPSPARSDSSAPSTPLHRPLFSSPSGGGALLPLTGLMPEAPALLPGDVGNKDLFFCHLCSYVGEFGLRFLAPLQLQQYTMHKTLLLNCKSSGPFSIYNWARALEMSYCICNVLSHWLSFCCARAQPIREDNFISALIG